MRLTSPARALPAIAALWPAFAVPASGQTTGTMQLFDAPSGAPVSAAFPPETTGATLRVTDFDLINPSGPDSIVVLVTASADTEHVVLRSVIGSAAFNGGLAFEFGTVENSDDDRLQVVRGATMEASYLDVADDFGNPKQITVTAIVGAVTGAVSGEWTGNRSPYFVLGTPNVPSGSSLAIDAGVRVRFLENAMLVVFGSLEVNGTPADSVFMEAVECFQSTELRDWPTLDLRTDQGSSVMRYVVFDCGYGIRSSSPLLMENCTVRGQARTGLSASGMLTVTNSVFDGNEIGVAAENLEMSACYIHNNRSHGVSLTGGHITNTVLRDNGGWGLSTCGGEIGSCVITGNVRGGVVASLGCNGTIVFQNNDLFDNGPFADFFNDRHTDVNAQFNYWGPATTAEMNAGPNPQNIDRISDVYDDPNRGFVNYSHWLDSPVSTGVARNSWSQVKSMFR
jgi:hypothetical protein